MKHLNDDQIRRYVGGQLTGKRLAAFEAHLEGCAGCRREVAVYRAIDRAVAGLPEPEWLPERLLAEVAGRIRRGEAPGRRSPGRLWRLASVAAGLVAVLGVTLYAGNARFWHTVEQRNSGFYAEHYSFVTIPEARIVSQANGVKL